ncbi:hypothetical protein TNCV_2869901 [Trichonephila clavipes]|nr:hypothetical protein TNCV_2869901 [Trichonephila clavipes]
MTMKLHPKTVQTHATIKKVKSLILKENPPTKRFIALKLGMSFGTEIKITPKRGLLAMDHVILNHGQVTWMTPELAPPSPTTTPHQFSRNIFYQYFAGIFFEIHSSKITHQKLVMAKSKNHTNHNQNRKDHRNGIKRPKRFRQQSMKGARRNRRQTAGEMARHTIQATGRPISRFTVARRLHGGGLFARRPVRCVPLTPAHRRRRSLWCREHRNWRDNEWGRVLFTDSV